MLFDYIINIIISSFNKNTKILFICDSCHSGTIADLSYSWDENNNKISESSDSKIISKMICISGCLDNQTSADSYNLLNNNKAIGALTSTIIKLLQSKPHLIYDVFDFVRDIRYTLKKLNFTQYPQLTSSYDLTNDKSILPLEKNEDNIIKYPETQNVINNDNVLKTQDMPPYYYYNNNKFIYKYYV